MTTHKNYLTREGYQKLRDEVAQLINVERPKTVQAVSVAAAMGDRSENAEYIYGKRRLREIDKRIHFLQGRLKDVEIVDTSSHPAHQVAFGLWVHVEWDEDGRTVWYQIVGPDELDPARNRITFTSPLGRALLGKKPGDVTAVHTPQGVQEVTILKISIQMT